jgi:hypothetical protein
MALRDVPGIMDAIGNIFSRQQEQANAAETARRNKVDEALRTQQMSQAQSIADRNADLEQQRIDKENEIQKAIVAHQAFLDMPIISGMLQAGWKPAEIEQVHQMSLGKGPVAAQPQGQPVAPPALTPYRQQPTVQPNQSPQQPQQPQDTSGLPSDLGARLLQQKVAQTRAIAGAQAQGEQDVLGPVQQQQHQWAVDAANQQFDREKELKNNDYSQQTILEDRRQAGENARNAANLASEERRTGLTTATQMAMSNAERYTQLQIAGMAPAGPNGQVNPLVSAATAAAMSGIRKLDTNNPIDRAAFAAVVNQGGRDVSGVGEQLQNLQQLDSIYDRMQKWNDTYGGSGVIANKIKSATGNLISDAKPDYDSAVADFLKLAQGAEGANKGRVPMGQFSLEQGGMIKMTNNKKENDKIIQQGRDRVEKMKQAQLQGVPPVQQEAVAKTFGVPLPEEPTINMKTPAGDIVAIPQSKVAEAKVRGAVEVK